MNAHLPRVGERASELGLGTEAIIVGVVRDDPIQRRDPGHSSDERHLRARVEDFEALDRPFASDVRRQILRPEVDRRDARVRGDLARVEDAETGLDPRDDLEFREAEFSESFGDGSEIARPLDLRDDDSRQSGHEGFEVAREVRRRHRIHPDEQGEMWGVGDDLARRGACLFAPGVLC